MREKNGGGRGWNSTTRVRGEKTTRIWDFCAEERLKVGSYSGLGFRNIFRTDTLAENWYWNGEWKLKFSELSAVVKRNCRALRLGEVREFEKVDFLWRLSLRFWNCPDFLKRNSKWEFGGASGKIDLNEEVLKYYVLSSSKFPSSNFPGIKYSSWRSQQIWHKYVETIRDNILFNDVKSRRPIRSRKFRGTSEDTESRGFARMPRNFHGGIGKNAENTSGSARKSRTMRRGHASPFSRTGSADVPDESNACDVPSMPGTRRNQRLEYLAKRSCCRNRERGSVLPCFPFPSPSVIARSFRNLHGSSLFLRGYVCSTCFHMDQ